MKRSFDSENNCTVYSCPFCGHEYHEYYDYSKSVENKEEPFIEMKELLLYDDEVDWGPKRVATCHQYACPKCGILQIDTLEL